MQGEWITYPLQHGEYIWLSTSNTCGDPGIFARGSRLDCQKTALTTFFFSTQLIFQFYSGLSMVYLKENYNFSRFQRGSNIFVGGGGGGGGGGGVKRYFVSKPIELVIFQGDSDPLSLLWIHTIAQCP